MDGKKPAWMGDEDDFILEVAMGAPQEFDRVLDAGASSTILPGPS